MSETVAKGREELPNRRRSICQRVRIDGHTFHITFGQYRDGRLGEVWIDSGKAGTFTRGLLSALARMISLAIQSGCPLEEVVTALQGLNFPPNGFVNGSASVVEVSSVPDWVAQEIAANYLPGTTSPGIGTIETTEIG